MSASTRYDLPRPPVIQHKFEDTMSIRTLEGNVVLGCMTVRSQSTLMKRSSDMGVKHSEIQLNVIRRERTPT